MRVIRECGFTLTEREKTAEPRQTLGLVSLVIKNGRLRWFGHKKCRDDADLIKHSMMMEAD